MVRFSIIIPFYKGNRFLPDLFRIVKDNTENVKKEIGEEVELILVNDSPDEAVEIPAETEGVSYKILTHNQNRGIHQARVTGLSQSSGEYILFLDQDDEVAGNFLSDQYKKMQDSDVIIAGAFFENADGTRNKYYDKPGKIRKLTELSTYLKSHNQIISPGQCLIRKSAIPEEWTQNIMDLNGSDDLFLWILMFEKKCRMKVNPECLYTHKYSGENLSASVTKMTRSSLTFGDLLRKIPYVPDDHIRQFERSRNMDLEMAEASPLKKIGIAIQNMDIVMHRVWWKLKCM